MPLPRSSCSRWSVVVAAPGEGRAHDLQATVKLLPDAVVVEAGFDGDTPAEEAACDLTDAAGSEVARGKTDERGVCRLPVLGPGNYVAIVESIGHRDEVPSRSRGRASVRVLKLAARQAAGPGDRRRCAPRPSRRVLVVPAAEAPADYRTSDFRPGSG